MNLMDEIKNDIQQAVKEENKSLANTLKYLYSLLQAEEARGGEFDEEKAIKVFQKEMKAKKEALKMFEEAGREDLVENEKKEIKILEDYLPEMMSPEQIEAVVNEIIAEAGGDNFGRIMGKVMGKVKGKADGELVAEIVREKLNS